MMKKTITFVMLLVAFVCLITFSCTKNAPLARESNADLTGERLKSNSSPTNGDYDSFPLFADNFTSSALDTNKWFPRTSARKKGTISGINLAENYIKITNR